MKNDDLEKTNGSKHKWQKFLLDSDLSPDCWCLRSIHMNFKMSENHHANIGAVFSDDVYIANPYSNEYLGKIPFIYKQFHYNFQRIVLGFVI